MNAASTRHHLNYVVEGEGPPVILIHGIAASHADWWRLMPLLVSAGHQAIAFLIMVHGDNDPVPFAGLARLFSKGEKEILGQTPIEKRPHPVGINDLELGKLSGLDEGFCEGGDNGVRGIKIEEGEEGIPDLGAFRNFLPRQQDFSSGSCIQVDPKVNRAKDG